MTQELLWKTQEKTTKITTLKELLTTLINIQQQHITTEIQKNKNTLLAWLENNKNTPLRLLSSIQSNKKFTPQQLHELIIRELRKAMQ
jgi:hypothetical protein